MATTFNIPTALIVGTEQTHYKFPRARLISKLRILNHTIEANLRNTMPNAYEYFPNIYFA